MGVSGVHAHHAHRGSTDRVRREVLADDGAGSADRTGDATGGGGGEQDQATAGADAVQGGAGRRGRGHHRHGGGGGGGADAAGGRGSGRGHRMHGCGSGDGGTDDAATAAAIAQAEPKTPDNDATPELGAADALVQLGATGADGGAPLEAITADPGATAATGTVIQQLIAQVAGQFNGSPIANQVLGMIGQADAAIDLLPDDEFAARYGRAKGIYDPATKRIALPEGLLQQPELLRIVLLHEGVHWVQDNAPGGIAQVGGPLVQALQGAGALDARRTSQVDEAQAFVAEAYAAREAGIEDPGMGTSKGSPLGFDAVLARVNATPEYA